MGIKVPNSVKVGSFLLCNPRVNIDCLGWSGIEFRSSLALRQSTFRRQLPFATFYM
jgi:hypothetical protein